MSAARARIDGRELELVPGETLLDAAARLGIEIPTVCHLPGRPPDGGCRVCLVEVAGASRPLAACHTPVRDGMDVRTATPALERLRASVRALADAGRPSGPSELGHPYLRFDPSLCITCRRCLHVCEDVQGQFVYEVEGRGSRTRLIFGHDDRYATSPCTSCGACVEVCPTGALWDRDLERPAPRGELRTTRSTCGYCGVGCQVEIEADATGVRRIHGAALASVNRGHLCAKGRYAHGWRESPERLTQPLVRRDGRLVPIGWDEAIDFAARRLDEIHAAHGADSIAALTSSRSTNEAAYLLQKLFRSRFRSNNVDCCARVCHASTAQALRQATGTGAASACYDDIEQARLIVLVGANPTEAHPVIGARLLQAVRRGARLVVIDPRRTELASIADVFVQLRPGTNVPLLNALAKLLIESGRIDRGYLAARTEGFAELAAHVSRGDVADAATICAVPEPVIRAAAREIAQARTALFVSGLGTSELTQGTGSVLALANLALLTGSVGRPGAGLLPLRGQNNVQGNADMGGMPDLFTGYQPLDDPAVRARLQRLWGALPPTTPGKTVPEMLAAAHEGALRGLWIQGEDIAQSDPNQHHVEAALSRLEFLVIQEIFPSETQAFAHLVLPAAGVFEQDGTFTNAERRIQLVRAVASPPGSARPDWRVIIDVANALGCGWSYPTPADVMDEIARAAPRLWGGVSHSRLEPDGLQWPCPEPGHPGSKRLHVDGFARGRASLTPVDYAVSPEDRVEGFPYLLNTGRVLQQYNVGTMTRRTPNAELAPADELEIHPDDAAREKIADGDPVGIESRWGRLRARARVSTRVRPGMLFLSFHYPETHTNRVTGPWHDPVSHCPEYKVTSVRFV
ncbi:MAG: formate dehydrogenase subunit alpha [Deltaproteobacteria bacterium]|nr:formate dehydrogenase subunit alpha [Deltaproteobacteria bacterium]